MTEAAVSSPEARRSRGHRRRDAIGAMFVLLIAASHRRALAKENPGAVQVVMETSAGRIVLELAADKAPITTANFLRYVDLKRYDGATFYRALRNRGEPGFGLVQGGMNSDPGERLAPIAHESTTSTGLAHKDGTLSIARFAQGTATSEFFICVGDAPYLDANPSAPGDNAGFAAFGRVVEGMDVVRQIHAMPTSATGGGPAMEGQMLGQPVTITSARRATLGH